MKPHGYKFLKKKLKGLILKLLTYQKFINPLVWLLSPLTLHNLLSFLPVEGLASLVSYFLFPLSIDIFHLNGLLFLKNSDDV